VARPKPPPSRREKGDASAPPAEPGAGNASGGLGEDEIEFDDLVDQGDSIHIEPGEGDDLELTSEDVDEADDGEDEVTAESAQEQDEPSLDSEDDSLVEDPFTPGEGDSGWAETGRFRADEVSLDESVDPDSLPDESFGDLLDESFDEYGDRDDPMPKVPEPEQPLPSLDALKKASEEGEEASAVDTLTVRADEMDVADDPLRSEANRLLLQGKLDEALTTISTLRKMQPDDVELNAQYEELLAKVIGTYFPGETPDSMPRLTVSLSEITELVTDPLMGALLCRMDGKTPLRYLDLALPDLAPGSLYQLLSRAKGMGLVRMD